MPRYYVEEHVPCIMVTAKYIDANSEAEAIEKFEDIEYSEPDVFGYTDHDYDNADYEISIEKD